MRHIQIARTCLFWLGWTFAFAATAADSRLPDFTDLVETYKPAVVNISTTQKISATGPRFPHGRMPDLPKDSPFNDFFERFFGGEGEGGTEEYDARSLGSGFIIDKEGHVLTNYHVIKDADEIIVRLSDRREFVAELIGGDKRSDIAVLKIKADNLPVVKFGDPSKLRVGAWVLAIGSPFGFDHSVTAGIVSAKGRSLPSENYVPFIQTDVAINPGNSGGPLFNLDGEVIGINSQIYSRTGGFMGLSFAIPIDIALDVSQQLQSKGLVTRGWLGILIQDVTRELAESFKMDKPVGALVARVLPDGPAESAGFKVGDIIIAFDGREVPNSAALPPIVGQSSTGAKVTVKIIRDGKPATLMVKIGELPEDDQLALAEGGKGLSISELAVVVSELSAEQRENNGIDAGKGVLIEEIKPGAGQKAGLRRGDVILRVDNVDVTNINQLKDIVGRIPVDKSVPILVQRGSGPIFLALKIPK
ncbi:MAG: protease Do [Gammaproteobacteria bacterium]|nr:MAG: protease Do [Gammaproteobacteria bacterium]TND06925.1 MAG: protease Do [Gammaproteobacteria bacterium]